MEMAMVKFRHLWVLLSVIHEGMNADAACEAQTSCFSCGNGAFINESLKCNGKNDCGNWDDECDCEGKTDTLCRKQPCLSGKTDIRRRQMCDGRFDCPDLSDECLCDRKTEENELSLSICDDLLYQSPGNCCVGDIACMSNNSKKLCVQGNRICDGIQDCASGIDENSCGPISQYLQEEACKSPNTTRKYNKACACDDVVEISREPDEMYCRRYFYCDEDGEKMVSSSEKIFGDHPNPFIDWRRKFDGVDDCNNAMDEWHPNYYYCFQNWRAGSDQKCSAKNQIAMHSVKNKGMLNNCNHHPKVTLSSSKYLSSSRLDAAFSWAIGIVATIANGIVIVRTLKSLSKKIGSCGEAWSKKTNQKLVLNLSICDFILGIFSLIFSIRDSMSAGEYWKHFLVESDNIPCAVITFYVVTLYVSSLSALVHLTGVRLFTVLYPFKKIPPKATDALIVLFWMISLSIACLMFVEEELLNSAVSIPNLPQVDATVMEKTQVRELVRRADVLHSIYSRKNWTEFHENMSWSEMEKLITSINPKFGNWEFYSAHLHSHLCLPSLIVREGEPGWKLNLSILGMGIVSYLFVLISYLIIIIKTTSFESIRHPLRLFCLQAGETQGATDDCAEPGRPIRERRVKEDQNLQKLIFFMIVGNFLTWLPITVFNIISLSKKYDYKRTKATEIMAVLAIHVNCATNPFFYSRTVRSAAFYVFVAPFKAAFLRLLRPRTR